MGFSFLIICSIDSICFKVLAIAPELLVSLSLVARRGLGQILLDHHWHLVWVSNNISSTNSPKLFKFPWNLKRLFWPQIAQLEILFSPLNEQRCIFLRDLLNDILVLFHEVGKEIRKKAHHLAGTEPTTSDFAPEVCALPLCYHHCPYWPLVKMSYGHNYGTMFVIMRWRLQGILIHEARRAIFWETYFGDMVAL